MIQKILLTEEKREVGLPGVVGGVGGVEGHGDAIPDANLADGGRIGAGEGVGPGGGGG